MEKFTYRLEDTKSGGKTIIITRDGKDFPLHSRIDPLREGDKNAPDFNPGKYDLLVILGCGMGYHLSGLREKAAAYKEIIVIDILAGLEKELADSGEQAFLTALDNLTFITGEEPGAVEDRLMGIFDPGRFSGVQVVEHPGSFRLFNEYYESVKNGIRRVLDKKSGDKATVKAFGGIFLRNAVNNLENMEKLSPVSALAGRFSGKSALIVSSAPSVEKYIEEIKGYQGSFFIIAVDSALPILYAHDIRPEFVVSIDPQQRIHEHFLGHEGDGVIHIFSIVSPPSIVERYGGFLSLNSHPVSQVVEEFYPDAIGSIDSGTGSVAGDALSFALLAGFDNIGMTGFDFSFTDNIIYARGTSYQKRYSLYYNSRFVTPESFNAAYIFRGSGSLMVDGKYTRRSFTGYRESLVRLIRERCVTPPVIINSAGLHVSNGRYMEMKAFADICDSPKKGPGISHDNILNKSVKLQEIIDRKRIRDFLKQSGVKGELLKHSLGTDTLNRREERFLKLFSR